MMGIGKKEERKPAIELGQEISYMERKKKKKQPHGDKNGFR